MSFKPHLKIRVSFPKQAPYDRIVYRSASLKLLAVSFKDYDGTEISFVAHDVSIWSDILKFSSVKEGRPDRFSVLDDWLKIDSYYDAHLREHYPVGLQVLDDLDGGGDLEC